MHKYAYRVIFNQNSRQMMAAAALVGAAAAVQAQIVADPNAGGQRPVVDRSANGLPVVQIATPDAGGMSHNRYQQFNVDPNGAILNNATAAVQTQQGGFIGGNPNLVPGNAARIILNEVTGTDRSQLNGYVEVAGQRAEVIIANPNGISCRGCGFINTTRGVLTTGAPVFGGNGSLEAFRVTRGDIAIDALQGGNTGQLDLIARSVRVNGDIWADRLNVISGANQVRYADLGVQIIAGDGARPTVGIDVAQLGGMYANKIRLVGTEAGVGVASLGNIAAQAGDLHIDNQGKITLKGKTSASGDLTIHGGGDVDNSGTVHGGQTLAIDSAGSIASSGTLAAQGDVALIASGKLDNAQGDIQSGQALQIDAADIDNSAGKLFAGTDLNIAMQGDYTNGAGDRIGANRDFFFSTTGKLTNAGALDAVRELHLSVDRLDNRETASINAAATIIHAADDIRNTGRIYGDRIAIAAATLTNTADNPGGQAGVIASRGDLDIGAADTFNLEGAQLYSAGDLSIGRTLDGDDRATGKADQIQNQSARIESGGAMRLAADNIVNRNNHFATEQREVSSADIVEYQLDGSPRRWDAGQVRQGNCAPDNFDCLFMPDGSSGQDYTVYRYKRRISQTFITESEPAEILAGGDLAVTGDIVNDNSRVAVGGALSGALDSLTNNQAKGVAITTEAGTAQHTSTTWRGGLRRKRERVWDDQVAYQPAAAHRDSPMQIDAGAAASPGAGASVVPALLPGLVLPNNPMFVYHPEPGQHYLIETDPDFTDYKTFLSSDYMLGRMAMDPAVAQKRLGDGYYEQKLINDQIAELTGKRFLGAYSGNEAQYQALMDAGIASAGPLQLTPGVALSAAQKASLTHDIVWLVSQDITLPDGSVATVLAPVVYLAAAGTAAAQPGSASISAKDIDLNIARRLNNGGTVQASRNLLIQAGDIANSGAIASDKTSGNTVLTAANDLLNSGGKIGGHRVGLLAGNDLVVSTTTTSATAATGDAGHGSRSSHTLINSVAGIEAGQLDMRAGRDIDLDAAQIAVTGDAVIAAGRDLKLNAVATETSLDLNADANNHLRQSRTQAEGTQIQADGAIAMTAGRDIKATAAYVNAGQALTVAADRDIRLDSAQQNSSYDQEIRTTSSGLLASSTKHIKDKKQSSEAVGTTFSGDSVQIAATRDISVAGGYLVGTHDVSLAAGNDIRVETSENTAGQSYYKEETTDGLFGTDGGIGVTMGSKVHQNTQTTQQTSHNGSMIGSTDGNVRIVAGNNYTQSGSNVAALAGDIGIAAKSVDIEAVRNIVVQTTRDHTEQSGLTLGVSAPIISAIQAMQQMKSASGKTDDPRMKALAAATAASSAQSAAAASQNPADGVTISLTVGASKSDSQSRQITGIAAGSGIKAGGNVVIAAVGDGKNSHLNVIGSDVEAGQSATLKADGDISLRAAQNSSDQRSKNSSSSAAVGIAATYGKDGFAFGITANAAGSRGKADGSDVANNNTHIIAGDSLTLESGRDTTLSGAVASAREVIANVGTSGQGDLAIQSLQDTSSYKSKDQHIGGSVTIGYGASGSFSAGQSKVDGDYASVGEQSGIKAGDGGFNVHVHGNTGLAGGVIASAASADKNLLVTETLTQSDIENHSRYEASSISIGGGYGKQANADGKVQTFTGGATGTAGGYSSTEGSANGTTRGGVGAGTIVITDDRAQQQRTGQTAAAAVDGINRDVGDGTASSGSLAKDWDAQQLKDKVNAESQITAAFGSAAAKQIGDYATQKYDAAMASGDKEEAAKWAEGGAYRVAMHTAVGALTGNVEGAAGAFVSAESMKAIGDAIDGTNLPKGIKQGLSQVVATTVGAAVGGGAGAMAGVNVEANNRQLHISEIEWIDEKKKNFSKVLADQLGRPVTDEEAMVWLTMAGEGDVDRTYQDHNSLDLGLQTSETWQAYNAAKKYITQNTRNEFIDGDPNRRKFVAYGNDFKDSSVNGEYRNNQKYRDFYWKVRRDNLKPDNPTPQELATYNSRERIRLKSELKQFIIDGVPAAIGGMAGAALNRGAKPVAKESVIPRAAKTSNVDTNIATNSSATHLSDMLSAANKPFNDSGLSVAARAWEKHAGRPGGSFKPVRGNTARKNEAAQNFVKDVLNNSHTTQTSLSRGGVEYRLPSGQGVRFNADGSLSGFLDPKR